MANNIELILKIITADAEQALNSFKSKIADLSNQKIELSGKDVAKEFDAAKNAAANALETSQKVVASMALAGQAGTKEFTEAKNQLKEAKKNADEFEKALKKADPTGLGDKFKGLVSSMPPLALTLGAGLGLEKIGTDLVALDTATAKIRTLGGEAAVLAPKFQQISIEMSKNFPLAAKDIQDSIYDALSAGINASEQSINAFTNSAAKLSVGGSETMKNSVNLLSSVLNAYGASAEEAAKYSDTLFNTVNLGKTTIPELSASLSQVIPSAAEMGVTLENVGGALALMTANGIPTAQATTKLNQLLVEIKKPGEDFELVMRNAGVTLESLQKDGLPVTIEKLKATMTAMGKQSGQVFSSTEASAAFATLAKDVDKFKAAYSGVADVSGSTEAAFQAMQESVSGQLQQLITSAEATVMNIGQSLLPILGDGLSGVKAVFDSIGWAISNLSPLIAGATTAWAAYKFVNADLIKDGYSFLKMIYAKVAATVVETTATGAATTATTLLSAAWAANPVGLVIAGVAAAAAGIYMLVDALSDSSQEKLEDAKASKELIDSQIKETKSTLDNATAKKKLLDEYVNLAEKSKRTAAEQSRYNELQSKLSKDYPDIISKNKDYAESLGTIKDMANITNGQIDSLRKKLSELGKQQIEATKRVFATTAEVAKDSLIDSLKSMYSWGTEDAIVRLAEKRIQEIYNAKNEEELQLAGTRLNAIVMGDIDNLRAALREEGKLSEYEINKVLENVKNLSTKDKQEMLKAGNYASDFVKNRASLADAEKQIAKATAQNTKDSTNEQKTAYDQLNDKITSYAKQRSKLADKDRQEKETALNKDIEAARQQNTLSDTEVTNLRKRLDVLKNLEKVEDERAKKQVDNLKTELDKAEQSLDNNKVDAENLEIAKGKKLNLEQQLKFTKDNIEVLAKYKQIATDMKVKISTKEGKEEFDKFIKDIEKKINDKNNGANKLVAEITADTTKTEEELRDLTLQAKSTQLDIAVNSGDLDKVISLRKEIIDLSEKKAIAIQTKINTESEETEKQKLTNELIKLQQEIYDKKLALKIDIDTKELEKVADTSEYLYKEQLINAQRTYDSEVRLAGNSIAKKLIAEQKFNDSVREIEQKRLANSTNFYDKLRVAAQNAAAAMIESFNIDPIKDRITELEDLLKNVGKTADYSTDEKKLNDSLQNREISSKQYISKLEELEKKKNESSQGMSETELRFRLGLTKAAMAISETYSEKANKASQEASKKIQDNIAKLTKEGKISTAGLSDIISGATENLTEFAENAVGSATAGFGAMLASGMEVGEAFRKGILGTLLKTAQQAILTYIPVIYSSFMSWLGPWGIAAATGAIAFVYAGLEAAKGAIGLKDGKVGIEGPGNSRSDSIAARLSVGEAVINAIGTANNYDDLVYINETNKPISEKYRAIYEQKSAEKYEKIVKGLVEDFNRSKAAHDSYATYIAQQNNSTIKELTLKVDELGKEIRRMNNRQSVSQQNIGVDIEVNDKELIKRVNYDKHARLRRS